MRYFKVVGQNNQAWNHPEFVYVPGEWTPLCVPDLGRSGYHVTDAMGVVQFIKASGPKRIYEVEVRGRCSTGHMGTSGAGLYAFESIRLVREVHWNGMQLLDALGPADDLYHRLQKEAVNVFQETIAAASKTACEQIEKALGYETSGDTPA